MRKNKYDNQFMCKISWKPEVDTSSSEFPERGEAVSKQPVIAEKEGTQQELTAQTFQPGNSYVPLTFLKQQYPEYLLEFYERSVKITGYKSLVNKE